METEPSEADRSEEEPIHEDERDAPVEREGEPERRDDETDTPAADDPELDDPERRGEGPAEQGP